MATDKKAKGRTKRKKASVSKPATRSKTKVVRKRLAEKAPVRRASPKKAGPTVSGAAKPKPATQPGQPAQATRTLGPPPQPAALEERIGVVTHYYSHLSVATLRLESDTMLRVGDMIHIRGHTTDFSQRVESLEVNHAPATEVGLNDDFGLKVAGHAREHDVVYKVRP
jgi:hypothetical protein